MAVTNRDDDSYELVTTADVAVILGVTSRRARWLADHRPGFPAPYAVTPSGIRLWHRADIERWDALTDRSPGRPVQK